MKVKCRRTRFLKPLPMIPSRSPASRCARNGAGDRRVDLRFNFRHRHLRRAFTLFATYLGATPFQFGLLAAIPFLAQLISMPASLLIERTGRRKADLPLGPVRHALHVAPDGGAAAADRPHMGLRQTAGDDALHRLYFLMNCGQAVGGPAWTSWMADVVPERVRGKYFSRRRQWGILSAHPRGDARRWLLDRRVRRRQPDARAWGGARGNLRRRRGVRAWWTSRLFHFVPEIRRSRRSAGRRCSARSRSRCATGSSCGSPGSSRR